LEFFPEEGGRRLANPDAGNPLNLKPQ
jgi:hypothetical protein